LITVLANSVASESYRTFLCDLLINLYIISPAHKKAGLPSFVPRYLP